VYKRQEVKNTSALMDQAREATTRVKASSDVVGDYLGKALNNEVVVAFQQLVTASAKVTALMAEVSAASEEQANSLGQVSSSVADMDRVTQTNAATSEECAAASEELSAQAVAMEDQVEGLARLVERQGAAPAVVPAPVPAAAVRTATLATGRPTATQMARRTTGADLAAKPARTPTVALAKTATANPVKPVGRPSNAQLLPLTDDEANANAQGDFSRF
jgi:hypothetical protein